MNILLVEDNATIATQVTNFLEGLGWSVDYAGTGQLGMELACSSVFDVMILDLNLPDIDGLDVCRAIRSRCDYELPVLMLTARDAFEDKARGYGEGADDYVTKPFDLRELRLRCEALARRRSLHQNKAIELGDLYIATREKSVKRKGEQIKLTGIGYRILEELARAHPQPVTRSDLLHRIWGDTPPDSDALRSHIYSLRAALDKPFDRPLLVTLPGLGYRLDIDAH